MPWGWVPFSPQDFLLQYGARSGVAAPNNKPRHQIGVLMPKQKTHKGTKKRFRLTATGKAKHRQAGTSHLAARMSQKRKRNLRGTTTTTDSNSKIIAKALAGNSY